MTEISDATLTTPVLATDMLPLARAGDDTARRATVADLLAFPGGNIPYSLFQARLTLTTAVPVTLADVTAATTLYLTPYHGNQVGLYTAAAWELKPLTEISISLAGLTASKPYDVFIYNNAGVLTLELLAWTSDTVRATALVMQDGILCKTGALSRRYCGTIRTTVTTGQCEDSLLRRFVWNNYNRVRRQLRFVNETGHTYNSATLRYWNNSAASIMEAVFGLAEEVTVLGIGSRGKVDSAAAGRMARILPCLDSPTAPIYDNAVSFNTVNIVEGGAPMITVDPLLGYHFFAASEACASPGTATFDYVQFNGMLQG